MSKALVLVAAVLSLGSGAWGRQPASAAAVAEARYFASAAFVSYCPAASLNSRRGEGGAKVHGVASSWQGIQGVVFRDSRRNIVISFRGSVNAQNWATNAQASQVQVQWGGVPAGVRAHSGFYQGYISVRAQIWNLLRQAMAECPSCGVVVTGHSLGGALAGVCALDLSVNGGRPRVFVYGMPRTGNPAFARFYNSRLGGSTVRSVNNNDMITKVPPKGMFQHVATEYWSVGGSVYRCNDMQNEDSTCSGSSFVQNMMDHMTYFNKAPMNCFSHMSTVL